jgi:hypothetical protein
MTSFIFSKINTITSTLNKPRALKPKDTSHWRIMKKIFLYLPALFALFTVSQAFAQASLFTCPTSDSISKQFTNIPQTQSNQSVNWPWTGSMQPVILEGQSYYASTLPYYTSNPNNFVNGQVNMNFSDFIGSHFSTMYGVSCVYAGIELSMVQSIKTSSASFSNTSIFKSKTNVSLNIFPTDPNNFMKCRSIDPKSDPSSWPEVCKITETIYTCPTSAIDSYMVWDQISATSLSVNSCSFSYPL